MKVLRIYHGGRDAAHRLRERALGDVGVDVTLVIPAAWSAHPAEPVDEPGFRVVELPVTRTGDVNRHRYTEVARVQRLIESTDADILDVHEEPVSDVAHQLLSVVSERLPISMYTAQNLDKRFPPPYSRWERQTLGRVDALYPCSLQAASVARGKGFEGLIRVLPLGIDEDALADSGQDARDDEFVLGLVGRLVPEKGVVDAVRVLAALRLTRRVRLMIVGRGPELAAARSLAAELGVAAGLEVIDWVDREALLACYRRMHVLLLPSRSTGRWVEQFGRVIVEAQAAGAVVAGYATGSIPEVAGDTAVLVADGDWRALGGEVKALLAEPERWRRLRDAGREAATSRTWRAIGLQQAEMYDEMLRRGPARRRTVPVATPRSRATAHAEFGAPATAQGQHRPFALPVLRDHSGPAGVLGQLVDVGNTVAARLHRR